MLDFTTDEFQPDVNIKVIGVGGGGGNALNRMAEKNEAPNIEFIAVNTDAKALGSSKATTPIQIGKKLARGRGAGNKPSVGQQSAEENSDEIVEALKGADMVFITAGMGGGTGTGAAPVVARLAQEMGILTVAVVTKPFAFEREAKMAQAERGITELRKYVDSLIVIPNEKLLEGQDKPLTMMESFRLADTILETGVTSISNLITEEGFINLDFADVSTIMKGAGYAHMAIGTGSGKEKAKEAASAVVSSPLLETSISGAHRLLINIAMSEDVLSSEMNEASEMITSQAAPDVEFIFGATFKEELHDEMVITVIAAGFDEDETIPPLFEQEEAPVVAPKKVETAPVAPAKAEAAAPVQPIVEEPIRVDNPLIEDVRVRETRTAPTAQDINSSVDDDLMAIFNILDRK